MTYDPKCYEFARTWLIGENLYTVANAERLAQAVQDVCESEVDEIKKSDERLACLIRVYAYAEMPDCIKSEVAMVIGRAS